ncbi:N-acetylgalactosamine-6-sulfatase [Labilibacter sediminis]|nr:N-acetylgalactosamine-6-sulfatase [Labilibacter sediminis]
MKSSMKKQLVIITFICFYSFLLVAQKTGVSKQPNIILMMCDDLGYGDTGFNGSKTVLTPNLDHLAQKGIKFTRFFSGSPVCSPTRGTCLTGRHHFRYGIWKANTGRVPEQEITIPEVLHKNGYATGHFGKWHLGAPHKEYKGKGGGENAFCPPEWFKYDESFITHHSVKLYNPYGENGEEALNSGNPYWHNGERVTKNITGDDNRIIMDRVIPWVEQQSKAENPFFMVLWWHTPHTPVDASPKHRAIYKHLPEREQKYYGAITAMDEQVGRLMEKLRAIRQLENTIIWFCSDNGPIKPGSTAGLKGSKGQLYNGGVVVPAFLFWEGKAKAGRVVDMPCSTLDYLPTLFDITGIPQITDRPIDGISLLPMINGENEKRSKGIPFRFENARAGAPRGGLLKGKYKYLTWFDQAGKNKDLLFDIMADIHETNDISQLHPEIVMELKAETDAFLQSAKKSFEGEDYNDDKYVPSAKWMTTNYKASGGKKGKKANKNK